MSNKKRGEGSSKGWTWSSKGPTSPPKVSGWLWWTEPKYDFTLNPEALRKQQQGKGRQRKQQRGGSQR